MHESRRSVLALLAAGLFAAGCAHRVYQEPENLVLQDPLPGQALVYFIRTPHDFSAISIASGGKLLAKLPKETFTALSVAPGEHIIETYFSGTSEVATGPIALRVAPDTRYFLALTDRRERPGQVAHVIDAIVKGPLAWAVPAGTQVSAGSREWKAYEESDARPLITIAELALPER
jgi:hypothetical protein